MTYARGRRTFYAPPAWDPLAQPEITPDTLFLLDPDAEQALTLEQGRLVPGVRYSGGWQDNPPLGDPASPVELVGGRFRTGLRSPDGTSGAVDQSIPANGNNQFLLPIELPTDQFTVAFWLKSESVDWAAMTGTALRVTGYVSAGVDFILGPDLTWFAPATFRTYPVPSAGWTPAAGAWGHIALTLNPVDRKIRIYVDGVERYQADHTAAMASSWNKTLTLNLFNAFVPTHRYVISDLWVARLCRTPGVGAPMPGPARVVVNSSAPTGQQIERRLRGMVHTLRLGTPPAPAASAPLFDGLITVDRIDKQMSATPAKAGAPDATRPTLGHSGNYSYDWQVVDRTLDQIAAYGAELYLSLDSVPQLLGGAAAPLSGTNLTTLLSGETTFNPLLAGTDVDALAEMYVDLLHRIKVEHPVAELAYVGIWNEPDLAGFNNAGGDNAAKLAKYLALYSAVAPAVKAYDPTLKVGGPEISEWRSDWTVPFIAHVDANALPLDFVSWHQYHSDVGGVEVVRRELDALTLAAGMGTGIELVCGEHGGVGVHFLHRVSPIMGALEPHHGSFGAAWLARMLIKMARANCVIATAYDPVPYDEFITGGTLAAGTHSWAPLNVIDQWSRMQADVVEVEILNAPPWIEAIASTDGDTIDVLIVSMGWREGDTPLEVFVPGAPSGTATVFVVDDEHSNWQTLGAGNQTLESVTVPVHNGVVDLTMKARSVLLVRGTA